MRVKPALTNVKSTDVGPVSWILGGLTIVTLYFQTNLADPFNSPKSWAVMLISAWLSGFLLSYQYIIRTSKGMKPLLYLVINFIAAMVFATIFTDFKFTAFFGDVQRRNGLISYISLSILILVASMFIRLFNVNRLFITIYIIAIVTTIYGYMQLTGNDFVNWYNPYNSIITTVGNPNFASAIFAIMGVVIFSTLFIFQTNFYSRSVALITSLSMLFLIFKSQSRQGMLAYIIGVSVFLTIYLFSKHRTLGLAAVICGLVGLVFSVLGMLQTGPLQNFLYKPSVSVRGYYWRAAFEMFKDNPILGVGIDRYGAYFKEYREVGYPLNYGFNITSSNAHNTFLQFFATGGIWLGLSYLVLNLYIFKRAVFALKHLMGRERLILAGIFSSWITFHSQSLISIDNIGVSVWGWVLGGAIIGISISESTNSVNDRKIFLAKKSEINLSRVSISSAASAMAIILVIVLFQGESNTYYGKATYNLQDPATRLEFKNQQLKIIKTKLIEPNYAIFAATDLLQAGYSDEALAELEKIYEVDSRNLDALLVLTFAYGKLNYSEKAIYHRLKMAELDPWNAVNYLELGKLYKAQGNVTGSIKMLNKINSFAANTAIAEQAKMELMN
jgi:O-antigen ligase